jgi:sugar phosphate isomerase/epimerase
VTRAVLLSTGAMTRDGVQTDHGEIVRRGPGLGVEGFELSLYAAWYGHLDDVIQDLRDSGLRFPVVHGEKLIGAGLGGAPEEADDALQRLEVNFRAAAALQAKTLILHLWERPGGDRELERNLERLPACLDMAQAYGITLAAETIPGDVGTPLENVRLAREREARCKLVLDTEFLGFYGQLEAAVDADWLWADGAVHHVHLKDFDGRLWREGQRRYLLPGEGHLDLQRFLTGIARRGYAGAFTLEATAVDAVSGSIDEGRLEQMASVARQLGS